MMSAASAPSASPYSQNYPKPLDGFVNGQASRAKKSDGLCVRMRARRRIGPIQVSEECRDVVVRDRRKTSHIQFKTLCADEPPEIGASGFANARDRSEERRVGKECRSRW